MARDQAEPAISRAEHEIYTRRFLAIYDALILGLYLRWVWRCPRSVLADHYQAHTGRRHLDVGPGTGYFLDVADLSAETAITLLDPNPEVLAHAAHRLAGHTPTSVRADVCEPLPITGPFESAALNLVLHCIAGTDRKAAAIRHTAATLHDDGVLFGASVLGTPDVHAGSDAPPSPPSTAAGSSRTSTTPKQRSANCCTTRSATSPSRASGQ